MDRTQLIELVEDLSALLSAIDKLVPGRVQPELFTFLGNLPSCAVTADLLLAALSLQKGAPEAPRRRTI